MSIKILRMDYLKWQLRKDLVGKYYTTDLYKATDIGGQNEIIS